MVVVVRSGAALAEAVDERKAVLPRLLDHHDGGRTVCELDKVHDVELEW